MKNVAPRDIWGENTEPKSGYTFLFPPNSAYSYWVQVNGIECTKELLLKKIIYMTNEKLHSCR